MEASKDMDRVIDVLMLAGTLLLESGSEIHRVEDTMIRIAHSQGIDDCNALAMPVAIFFSIENANITRMKRILRTNYNIEKVCDVNQISRQLVSGHINLEEAYQALIQLKQKAVPYTNPQLTIAATLSAPFFSIMFGGNFYDAIGAGIATVFAYAFSLVVEKYVRIPFATAFAAAFVFGFLAHKLFETLLITLALGAGTTVALVLMK